MTDSDRLAKSMKREDAQNALSELREVFERHEITIDYQDGWFRILQHGHEIKQVQHSWIAAPFITK